MTQLIAIDERERRYGFRQALRFESIKLSTLRSTVWILGVTFVGTFLVTALSVNSAAHHSRSWYQGWFDPTNQSFTGLYVASLTIGLLGVLAVTGEYGTGTIRSSLSATPRRPLFVMAKTVLIGAACLVVGEVLTFSCFGLGQALLGAGGAPTASIGAPGVLRAITLTGAGVGLLGLLGLGLGLIIRNTAGALASYAGVTYIVPLVMQRIPGNPGRFTPIPILANSVSAVVPVQNGAVTAPVGFALLALYAGFALLVGAALTARRDA